MCARGCVYVSVSVWVGVLVVACLAWMGRCRLYAAGLERMMVVIATFRFRLLVIRHPALRVRRYSWRHLYVLHEHYLLLAHVRSISSLIETRRESLNGCTVCMLAEFRGARFRCETLLFRPPRRAINLKIIYGRFRSAGKRYSLRLTDRLCQIFLTK